MATRVEILGTVEAVIGLGSRIYGFFSSIEDAPEDVRQMCAQLQLLQKLFPEIGRSTSDLIHATPLVLDIIFVCLKGCESDFKTMWLAVEPLRTNRGIVWKDVLRKTVTSVKWVLKTEEFEKLTRNLERVKQTLALAMLLAGMRVDSAVLEGLSSIDTKLDGYGRMLDAHLGSIHTNIASQLEQLEYRFLQRVDVLSGAVAEVHGQSSLRVTKLYDSIVPGVPLQTDEISTVRSLDNDVNFAAPCSETPDVSSLDEPVAENQQADVLSWAMQDRKVDESVSTAFRNAIQRWNTEPGLRIHGIEHMTVKKVQTVKWADQLKGIFTNIGVLLKMPSNGSEYSALISDGVRALELTHLSWEHYELLDKALEEIQDAFETCVREYELYPEPRLGSLMMAQITDSFIGMTRVLQILRISPLWVMRLIEAESRAPSREDWEKLVRKTWEEHQKERLEKLQETVAKIRQSFRKFMKEVEYLHRKELRQAHLRLREIDRKQDRVIRALEEQQKILTSLQEEHRALSLINDHQKVLQMLQQLLAKFPSPAGGG